jgi:hypothetical protein
VSALFTQHAVERLRERRMTPTDRARLLDAIQRVADNPSELTRSVGVVSVGRYRDEDTFIVRAGDMRAVVIVDRAKPTQVTVINVFRADETEQQAQIDPGFDPRP